MDSMESMEPAESALRLRRHEPGRVGLGWTWHGQGRGVISAGPIRLMLDSGSQQSHFWANLQVLVPPEIWNCHDAMVQTPDWELHGIANPTGKKGKFGKNVQ